MDAAQRAARWTWKVLAVVDAAVLVFVASRFDWADFDIPRVGETPVGWIIVLVFYALVIALKVLAAAFVALAGYAIVMELRGEWKPRRLPAAASSLVFVAVLALLAMEAMRTLRPLVDGAAASFGDRLLVMDRLANGHAPGESIGAYVVVLCAAIYLAEKYLLRWWNLRWPISIAALAILAWPVWAAREGEREQREWVAAQQWRPVSESQAWPEALDACNALGSGWRLPRRTELSLYFSSRPDALRAWRGVAWTDTIAEHGRTAVVVDLVPRQSGWWRSNSQPWRDRSVCEGNATPNPMTERPTHDWFAELRPRLCASTQAAPGLYPSGLQLLAQMRGSIVGGPMPKLITQPNRAATICVQPATPETRLPLRGRGYPREREFTDASEFVAAMKEACRPQGPGDAIACATFAPEAAGGRIAR